MPVHCCFDVKPISKSQFYEVDHLVMHHAFEIQNEMGRLYDESVYHAELARRCVVSGLTVLSEGEIIVSHESFRKSYYIDALIAAGSICELKAVESLNGQHESQLLNYLLLSNLQYGKLINFSSPSVEYRFITTNLSLEARRAFDIEEMAPSSLKSGLVRDVVYNLLTDWGAFLDVGLYREAIYYFLGGEESLMRPIEIIVNGRVSGTQKMYCLNKDTCLHISSVVRHLESYKKQLLKMISHTELNKVLWVNFNRENVQLITLEK